LKTTPIMIYLKNSTVSPQIKLKNISPDADHSMYQLKVFTDNIVLGYPFYSEDGESEFGHTIWAIKQYQLGMALEGFFIRGGLSMGWLFMDNNTVYGDSLLEAYMIEHKIARDPRIVLSKRVLDLVKHHTSYYFSPQDSPQNRDVLIDTDGQAFVHYLNELILVGTEKVYIQWKLLLRHKNHIEAAIDQYSSDPMIWPKYYWLANYHNYFCKEVSIFEGFNESYVIQDHRFKREPQVLLSSPV